MSGHCLLAVLIGVLQDPVPFAGAHECARFGNTRGELLGLQVRKVFPRKGILGDIIPPFANAIQIETEGISRRLVADASSPLVVMPCDADIEMLRHHPPENAFC